MGILKRLKISCLLPACFLLFCVSFTSQAAPLNLNLQTPDLFANAFDTDYNANTDIFTVSTFTLSGYTSTAGTVDGGTSFFLDFSLTADISGGIAGGDALLNSGSFSLTELSCEPFGLNCTAGSLLLSGDLIGFGYANDTSQILEFLFDPTGGSLASSYGSGPGGIDMNQTGYLGDDDFNSSFSSSVASAQADIAPVPVPAAIWLFGTGLLGLVGLARRRCS